MEFYVKIINRSIDLFALGGGIVETEKNSKLF